MLEALQSFMSKQIALGLYNCCSQAGLQDSLARLLNGNPVRRTNSY
ncbi:MAG: hypothetical protein ACI909_004358 [Planctomycetota bacterium]|jgi:hypothetical protein